MGRTVYGGGGITPDIYIPYKSKINSETSKILRNPKRPFFNFASEYASKNKDNLILLNNLEITGTCQMKFLDFLIHLKQDSIFISNDSLKIKYRLYKQQNKE